MCRALFQAFGNPLGVLPDRTASFEMLILLSFQTTVYVHLIVAQSSSGPTLPQQNAQLLSPPGSQNRFTAERVLRTRPKTYRAIVQLLADPDAKVEHIARQQRVSTHTVRAIRARETVAIAERKQRLTSIFANVAEISAERMEELAGQASLRDAGITAGIATDKLLALSGDPSLTQTQQHLHLHLQSNDIARQFNALLADLQGQRPERHLKSLPDDSAQRSTSNPKLTDKTTDQRESGTV
jgi:hypothetical protein